MKANMIFSCLTAGLLVPLGSFLGTASAQTTGSCAPSTGEAYLEANNVRARIPNTGGLFYRGMPYVYRVPRFSNANAIFVGSVWIAGKMGDKIHASASKFGPSEFWAGPLDDQANPPVDCDLYDRVYSVRRSDLDRYEETGSASEDLKEWPTGLGAPTLDENGNILDLSNLPFAARKDRIITLSSGERPAMKGDQVVWWIMNDLGNIHESTKGPPIGLEIHGNVYAIASTTAAINNSTMYNYRVLYRGTARMDSVYVGIWIDHDLGDASDDYMGSDSLLGMGYGYNADNSDVSGQGYGTPPPAIGLMLLQGPIADLDGLDNNRNGLTDESGERAHVATIMRVKKSRPPMNGEEYYNHLRGRWNSGKPMTLGAYGDDYPGTPVNYAFPADPANHEFWSMVNIDNNGTAFGGRDTRLMISVGPLTFEPGEEFDLTFAVVWAIGEDHLDSVTELKKAAVEVKSAFENGFTNIRKGEAPSDPVLLLSPGMQAANQPYRSTLRWTPVEFAEAYDISLITADTTTTYRSEVASLRLDYLVTSQFYFWKVRGINVFGDGPWSEVWNFETGTISFLWQTPVFSRFSVVQNASGILEPPDLGAFAFTRSGFPRIPCQADSDALCYLPSDFQQSTNTSKWGIHAGGSEALFGPISDSLSFLGRVTRLGANLEDIDAFDYEIRFTDTPGKAFLLGSSTVINVPFELWNVGEDSSDDPSDDYRMIPVLCESACSAGTSDGVFDIGGDHDINRPSKDPYTDHFSWFNPTDTNPGDLGYNEVFDGSAGLGREILSDMVLVQFAGGSEPPYDVAMPEPGTVFRISTGGSPIPILAAPGRGAEFLRGTINFYWSGVQFDLFHVQIANSPGFESPLYDSDVAASNFEGLFESVGTYYWRVKGYGGKWSDTARFRIVESLGEDPSSVVPEVTSLSNYPNPFRANATITFDLFAPMHVRIDVFDLLGRHVIQLADHEMNPGRQRIPFDASRLSSGIYFYTLKTGDVTQTNKMVVAR